MAAARLEAALRILDALGDRPPADGDQHDVCETACAERARGARLEEAPLSPDLLGPAARGGGNAGPAIPTNVALPSSEPAAAVGRYAATSYTACDAAAPSGTGLEAPAVDAPPSNAYEVEGSPVPQDAWHNSQHMVLTGRTVIGTARPAVAPQPPAAQTADPRCAEAENAAVR